MAGGPAAPSVRARLASLFVGLVSLALVATAVSWIHLHRMLISEAEAIGLAERFVAENGYTDLPIAGVAETLAPEPVVFTSSRAEELESRRDTLERRAVSAYNVPDGGWIVTIRYKGRDDRSRGVVMDDFGRRIHILHQDVY